jgi:hypothetical protein
MWSEASRHRGHLHHFLLWTLPVTWSPVTWSPVVITQLLQFNIAVNWGTLYPSLWWKPTARSLACQQLCDLMLSWSVGSEQQDRHWMSESMVLLHKLCLNLHFELQRVQAVVCIVINVWIFTFKSHSKTVWPSVIKNVNFDLHYHHGPHPICSLSVLQPDMHPLTIHVTGRSTDESYWKVTVVGLLLLVTR